MIEAALERGFNRLGFSSHAMFPAKESFTLDPARASDYVAELRALAAEFRGRLEVLCGFEADYLAGVTTPDRGTYAAFAPDYLIGSIHWVRAADGAAVAVDESPETLAAGIAAHFGGRADVFVKAYHRTLREMVGAFDFDVVGHPDLYRKFNARAPFFDESAAWHREEIERTAAAIAGSGKIVEVNTGAIGRGWLDDAYPSAFFRGELRRRGVKFVLDSDAHSAAGLDAAFDRFAAAEEFIEIGGAR